MGIIHRWFRGATRERGCFTLVPRKSICLPGSPTLHTETVFLGLRDQWRYGCRAIILPQGDVNKKGCVGVYTFPCNRVFSDHINLGFH
jgi:transposase